MWKYQGQGEAVIETISYMLDSYTEIEDSYSVEMQDSTSLEE